MLSPELRILSEIRKALDIEEIIKVEDLPKFVSHLKRQHDDLHDACITIAKQLGLNYFDSEQVLVEIEKLQETDEGNDYWHNQYTELLKEFRAYTSNNDRSSSFEYLDQIASALGLSSFRYCDLPKEVLALKNESIANSKAINQFRDILDEIGNILHPSGRFSYYALPKEVTQLQASREETIKIYEDMVRRENKNRQALGFLREGMERLELENRRLIECLDETTKTSGLPKDFENIFYSIKTEHANTELAEAVVDAFIRRVKSLEF